MRIAVIGAGFCGLSTAWHLLDSASCEVVLFDRKGVGGGASGIAAGLMHPYAGMHGRRSVYAAEAMEASRALMGIAERKLSKKVILSEGILRHAQNAVQAASFSSHIRQYGDVESVGESQFLIRSGATVDCPLYLEGLWRAVESKGGKLICKEMTEIAALSAFDHVVIAAGGGILQFPECSALPIGVLRGQLLKLRMDAERSAIGNGYLALSGEKGYCYLGSTYERGNLSDVPDLESAKRDLFPKMNSFFPSGWREEVVECKAALRVTRHGHYTPLIERLGARLWAFTALGSRGLLYHAYFGRQLAKMLLEGK